MYLFLNSISNIIRNKGRNTIIAIITLAIILSAVVTLTINNAAAKIIDDIRLDLGSRVEIRQDFIEMRQIGLGREDASYISMDSFLSFADSNYLRTAVFNADMYAWSNTLRAVDDTGEIPGSQTRVNDNGETVLVETSKLVSTSHPESLSFFGTQREIIHGRMFESLNECIISEELALLNNLSLGDTIELSGTYAQNKHYSLTITGIYSDSTDAYANFFLMLYGRIADNRRNEIITSFDTLMSAGWETNAGLDINNTYFLRNPDDIRRFENEVRAKGLPLTYNVSINQAAFDKVTGPLSGVNNAVITFMTVILLLGGIVLALLSFMAVRERKYEVGVLRAMGLAKPKVALGILAEAVLISALCLVLGLSIGNALAQPIAEGMMEGRVSMAEMDASDGPNRFLFAGGQMQTNDNTQGFEIESELQVNLNSEVLSGIIGITFLLAAISGLIAVFVIIRYEPLKILSERI